MEQGKLTAAGGTDDDHRFALVHGEGHAVKGAGNVRLCAIILFQDKYIEKNGTNVYLSFSLQPTVIIVM